VNLRAGLVSGRNATLGHGQYGSTYERSDQFELAGT